MLSRTKNFHVLFISIHTKGMETKYAIDMGFESFLYMCFDSRINRIFISCIRKKKTKAMRRKLNTIFGKPLFPFGWKVNIFWLIFHHLLNVLYTYDTTIKRILFAFSSQKYSIFGIASCLTLSLPFIAVLTCLFIQNRYQVHSSLFSSHFYLLSIFPYFRIV